MKPISGKLNRHSLLELWRDQDGEYEMILNRFAIGTIATVYTALQILFGTIGGSTLPLVCVAYLSGAGLLLLDAVRRPALGDRRRLAACILDTGLLSVALYSGGEVASPFYPVYLWIILGNGFRFGVRWLRIACAASVVGFGVVVFASPYWAHSELLGVGLLAGLVAIPLYAQVLILKLSNAKLQAEQANAAKTLFLASVSHELRTPLNAVTGMTGLLFSTPLDAGQREMAGTIRDAAASLLHLIDDILSLSRTEAGRMPVTIVAFDLPQLVRDVLAIVTVQARTKGLRLHHHITARTPLDVMGDARHLREMLLNLLSNSVKFTASGSVMLAVDASWEGNRLLYRFEVTDTGIGIDPADHARIFDDFSQADANIMNRFGGTGLGLAITRRLAALLGGTIAVESAIGSGSTFTVELPMQGVGASAIADQPGYADVTVRVSAVDAATMGPLIGRVEALGCTVLHSVGAAVVGGADQCALVVPSSQSGAVDGTETAHVIQVVPAASGLPPHSVRLRCATSLQPNAMPTEVARALRIARSPSPPAVEAVDLVWVRARRFHILVADDNTVNRRVVGMMLERAGHTVAMASNGEEALEAMHDGAFDAVLMDLNMPVMNGIEATKLYRFGAIGMPRLVILGLTADVTGNTREQCLAAGMDGCHHKPIDPKQLLDSLDKTLAGRATKRPQPTAIDERRSVASIASHPRYRLANIEAVDFAVLEQLGMLGGAAFLSDLIDEFEADASRLEHALQASIAANDVTAVSFHAHALLSAAANMGATSVQEICHDLQRVSRTDLAGQGRQVLHDLRHELVRVSGVLARSRLPPATQPAPFGLSDVGD